MTRHPRALSGQCAARVGGQDRPTRAPRRTQGSPLGPVGGVGVHRPAGRLPARLLRVPLYRNVELSLKHYTVRSFVDGNAPFIGLDNYVAVFRDPAFGSTLLHTALFTGVSIAFQFTIGMAPGGVLLPSFRLSGTLRALFLVPWLLPLIVSALDLSGCSTASPGCQLGAAGVRRRAINWPDSPTGPWCPDHREHLDRDPFTW